MDKSVIRSLDAVEHRFEARNVSQRHLNLPQHLPEQVQAQVPDAKVLLSRPHKQRKRLAGAALIGIDVGKEDDFSTWYQQVLLKGDMIDYYDISGCYILKPYPWNIWERLSEWFDVRIKKMGIRNCLFPMFVTEGVLQKEKDHIEGFAAEVAWVTQSHSSGPVSFFWQEGHTAHLRQEGADKEVLEILDLYAQIYEELLAVPVIQGRKTDKEKFAGGLYTTTVEAYIAATGRGIQGATSHGLGQNFSKMFGISVEDPMFSGRKDEAAQELFVWQNSWAFSTRVIGVMVMTHGDNHGLVMPPRVAPIQAVIVPVSVSVKTPQQLKDRLFEAIQKIVSELEEIDVRVEVDLRDYSPGYKFNHWELMGVPIRIEFGPGELDDGCVTTSRRDLLEKGRIQLAKLGTDIPLLLDAIHLNLYNRARDTFSSNVKILTQWDIFVPALDAKHVCLVPFCLAESCEDIIRNLSSRVGPTPGQEVDEAAPSMGAKSLCIPFHQPSQLEGSGARCLNPQCRNLAKQWCLFGRCY